jgi:hypothetical protein
VHVDVLAALDRAVKVRAEVEERSEFIGPVRLVAVGDVPAWDASGGGQFSRCNSASALLLLSEGEPLRCR